MGSRVSLRQFSCHNQKKGGVWAMKLSLLIRFIPGS